MQYFLLSVTEEKVDGYHDGCDEYLRVLYSEQITAKNMNERFEVIWNKIRERQHTVFLEEAKAALGVDPFAYEAHVFEADEPFTVDGVQIKPPAGSIIYRQYKDWSGYTYEISITVSEISADIAAIFQE